MALWNVIRPFTHWEAAERHFRTMSAKYVVPTLAYAMDMVSRPGTPVIRTSQILTLMRQLDEINKIYTGPIDRSMDETLAQADMVFRAIMKRLGELDV